MFLNIVLYYILSGKDNKKCLTDKQMIVKKFRI